MNTPKIHRLAVAIIIGVAFAATATMAQPPAQSTGHEGKAGEDKPETRKERAERLERERQAAAAQQAQRVDGQPPRMLPPTARDPAEVRNAAGQAQRDRVERQQAAALAERQQAERLRAQAQIDRHQSPPPRARPQPDQAQVNREQAAARAERERQADARDARRPAPVRYESAREASESRGSRLSQQRQEANIREQQQRLAVYRQGLASQQDKARQVALQLQQQKRTTQYRYQQQYYDRMRVQQSGFASARHDYGNDPYYYTAPVYRYSRGGRYYEINRYGADVLRQALNHGYQEGFHAGRADRQDRWRYSYRDSFAYADANFGYSGYYVRQDDYQHYFREGFQRGYDDGYYSRRRHGRHVNGSDILMAAVLVSILNLQSLR